MIRSPKPLSETPNLGPYPYRDWVQAKATLEAALARGIFYALVTGPSGTGKTSLCRALSSTLDRQKHQILYLCSSRVSFLSVVRYFAQLLRVAPRRSAVETTKVLCDVLKDRGARQLIWIDEADRFPSDTLIELRSLTEFDHEHGPLVNLVLSGPPELRIRLDAPELFALKRRISIKLALEGLRREELDPFLVHRFGAEAKRVPQSLKDDLFERTRGTPALIDHVIAAALARTTGHLGDPELREALDVAGL